LETKEQPAAPTPEAPERFEAFAYVELFGHTQIAGRATSRPFGSTVFFQIDVLNPDGSISYSRLVSSSAIFSITPVDEAWCKRWAARKYPNPAPVPYLPEPTPAVDCSALEHDQNEDFDEEA
jgi:hypothetical protein